MLHLNSISSVLAFAGNPTDAEAVRAKVQEVLSRPEFQLDASESEAPSLAWLLKILEWLLWPFRWLASLISGLPEFLRITITVFLVLCCVALVGHILYSLLRAVRGDKRKSASLPTNPGASTDPDELEALADAAAAEGRLIDAVRYLLKASLVRCERREQKRFRRGMTNREYLRRCRNSAWYAPLETLVTITERKWYGDEPCEGADYQRCRDAYLRLAQLI